MNYVELATLIIFLIKLAAKEGPEVYEAIMELLDKLKKKEFTEEELLALKIDKSPEEFFAELEP